MWLRIQYDLGHHELNLARNTCGCHFGFSSSLGKKDNQYYISVSIINLVDVMTRNDIAWESWDSNTNKHAHPCDSPMPAKVINNNQQEHVPKKTRRFIRITNSPATTIYSNLVLNTSKSELPLVVITNVPATKQRCTSTTVQFWVNKNTPPASAPWSIF